MFSTIDPLLRTGAPTHALETYFYPYISLIVFANYHIDISSVLTPADVNPVDVAVVSVPTYIY